MHRTLIAVRHKDATGFDEREWGPLPLAATPTATSTSTPTPTSTATSTATPTPSVTPSLTTSATPTASVTSQAGTTTEAQSIGTLGWLIPVAGGGAVAILLALGGGVLWRRRKTPAEYRLNCGHKLDPGGVCPHCGARGKFRDIDS